MTFKLYVLYGLIHMEVWGVITSALKYSENSSSRTHALSSEVQMMIYEGVRCAMSKHHNVCIHMRHINHVMKA